MQRPSFAEAFRFWVKLGFINFGGPAGQIAMMHRELVDRRRWIGEQQFLRALNFCMLLPGPEAQQLAIYIGWRLHSFAGGIVAGAFFVVPSIFVLLALSWLSAAHGDVPVIAGLLYGIQPVVIAILLDALLRVGKRTLRHPVLVGVAAAAFVAIYVFGVRFPVVVLCAAGLGWLIGRRWPEIVRAQGHGDSSGHVSDLAESHEASGKLSRNLKVIAICALLWAVPFALLVAFLGPSNVLTQEMVFFTQAAFVTFGGAYAVLSYITRVTVNDFHWLDIGQMVHGLGLAESTPGPLIMVTEYVGFWAGWNNHGQLPQLAVATAGALITVYATFLPCFLFVFLGAPYIERLSNNEHLQTALTGVSAAVVGVILNLSVFFAIRVLFPEGRGLDVFALAIAVVSFAIIKRLGWPTYLLVPAGAAAGMIWALAGMLS
jgi:chromate transporter